MPLTLISHHVTCVLYCDWPYAGALKKSADIKIARDSLCYLTFVGVNRRIIRDVSLGGRNIREKLANVIMHDVYKRYV